jgi:hypothetical protein
MDPYCPGVVPLLLIVVVKSDWRWLGLTGIIPLATAFLNFCPPYALFGLSTNKAKDKDNAKQTRTVNNRHGYRCNRKDS